MNQSNYSKYTFRDRTGYIVAPWLPDTTHELVSIHHSASVPPRSDPNVHIHSDSEEYYFHFRGKLQLLVNGSVFILEPGEALMVKPKVPHAVVGGSGPIENFVIRMSAPDGRQTVGEIPQKLASATNEAERTLQSDWGYRVPLTQARYQNCWLFGVGQAHFHSEYMCLAFLHFATDESVNAGQQSHRHRLHLHKESWEYYTVLKGSRIL
ncbi:MAG: cupin domain-containing protein [Chloroflexi bacterium]|nr:cupin domain-containing protein [Chloroflexota bacterium]